MSSVQHNALPPLHDNSQQICQNLLLILRKCANGKCDKGLRAIKIISDKLKLKSVLHSNTDSHQELSFSHPVLQYSLVMHCMILGQFGYHRLN